ncbi:MAG TPA: alpha/beta hydrolase [Steroidobacteraceae bacterium]|nr:alpha/beta hydrolase [Steroidobacteraceae bacterium]
MLIVLFLVAILALGALVGVRALLQWATFPAPPAGSARPGELAAERGESLWFDIEGSRVEAWLLPAAVDGPAPLLIYAHGNGELIDFWAKPFAALRAAGIHVLLVEFPGYGRSEGRPSERSITATLLAAYDRAVRDPRVDAGRIVGYGRSMGGGAIGQLAARRPLAALILESTFSSLRDMVRAHRVPDWLIPNRFDTRAVLGNYPGPVLLIHGRRDEIIPATHAQALATAAPRAALHLLPCGHNDCPRQWELILGFLAANGVSRGPDQEAP